MDLGHWQYPGEFSVTDWFGFIYRIIDTTNNMEYIGKKQFWISKKKKVSYRKNRIITKSESDWKSYESSSEYVKKAILEKGKENFIFLIEALYKTKGKLHYAEIESQITEDVLRATLPSGERKFYNRSIGSVRFVVGVTTTEELSHAVLSVYKERTQNTNNHYFKQMTDKEREEWRIKYRLHHPIYNSLTKEEYKEWCQKNLGGENNPMFGRTGELSPRFGKSPFEYFDDERMAAYRKNHSEKMSGENNPRFGKSPFENFTPEQYEEHCKKMSEKMSGEGNPMFGRPWYLNSPPEKIQEWKDNMSKALTGKKKKGGKHKGSPEERKQERVKCPYCPVEGGINNMHRFHFDNCKKKPQ